MLSQYNKIATLQGKELSGVLGNNSYIIDSFYDERFSPNYSGENTRVGNQIFTIKGFT